MSDFLRETDSNLDSTNAKLPDCLQATNKAREVYPLITADSPQVSIMSRNCFYHTVRREPRAYWGKARPRLLHTSPSDRPEVAARRGCQPKASTRRLLALAVAIIYVLNIRN